MKRIDIRVTGLVQGVGFRFATRNAAHRLGVNGTVRNDPDGSVFIEAEAEPAVLDEFVQWCHQGPSYSRVAGVEVSEVSDAADSAGFSGFEITG